MARQVIVSTLMSLATASVLLASTAAVAADSGSGSSSASAVGPVVASSSSSDAATTTTTAAAAASSSSDTATTTTTKAPTSTSTTTTTTKAPTSTSTKTTTTKASTTTTQATTLVPRPTTTARPTTQFANETLPPTAAPTRRPTTARSTTPTTTGPNGETDTTLATTTTEAYLAPTIVEMVMFSRLTEEQLYAAMYFKLMGRYPGAEATTEARHFSKMDTAAEPTIDVSCVAFTDGNECVVTITIPTVPEEAPAPGSIDLSVIRENAKALVVDVQKNAEDPTAFPLLLRYADNDKAVESVEVVGMPYYETPAPKPDTTTPEPFVGGTVARVATTAVACLLAAVVGLCAF